MNIGDRVTLHVKRHSAYPGEVVFDGQRGTVEDITANPWFPILVLIDGCEHARYFKTEEVEPDE